MIIQPHLRELVSQGKLGPEEKIYDLDILSLIKYENCGDLALYTNCFNESLRM